MIFKKLSINDVGSYEAKDDKLLKVILRRNYERTDAPMADVEGMVRECELVGRRYKPFRRDKYFIVRDFITCLAVCHNVTPTM